MSLRDSPFLYVFYETASLEVQRQLCEDILGLPVIENQFHPPHEFHGLVKYDAGQVILSLNLSREVKFHKDASDGLVTVLNYDNVPALLDRLRQHGYRAPADPGALFTDAYGHHYVFTTAPAPSAVGRRQVVPAVREFRLTVRDLASSLTFYGEVLGLDLVERAGQTARFATGTVDLVLQQADTAPDGYPVRRDTYLLVFYTGDIFAARAALVQRGLVFKSPRVSLSDIGHSARFVDPSGQTFCLYQPSEESLSWGSGPKVLEIAAGVAPREMLPLQSA